MGYGYSGSTKLDFEIERFKDKESGELLIDDKSDQEEFECEYQLITLKVEGSSYFQPGKYTGPWEDSYPDEGDTEITSVIGPDNKDWTDKLTSEERDTLVSLIEASVKDQDGRDYEPDDDRYDDDYDDSYDYEE